MKAFFKEFLMRGLVSAWGGPFVLAVVYYCVGRFEGIESIPANEVSLGIISITIMAFIAGGITAIYKNEKLPVVYSALIHAAALYIDYIIMYFLNDWIPRNGEAIGIFSAVFVLCYAIIWVFIYLFSKSKTEKINRLRGKN